MIVIYSVICALIFLRLITYRRDGSSYSAARSLLAYAIIVTSGSVPLRAIMGLLPPPDLSAVLLAAAVLAAVVGARGNISRFIPRHHPATTLTQQGAKP